MTRLIWNRYFLKKQGYIIHDNFIYQDNQIAIRLDQNGRKLSSKRTRHINFMYHFIAERIIKQDSSVEFCPAFDIMGIISQRHYRDLNYIDSETSFMVSMIMTFQPTNHLEELCLKIEE